MKTVSAISVKVGREHIKHGKRNHTNTCAVALAVRDHFEKLHLGVDCVEVDDDGVKVTFNPISFKPTQKLVDFIDDFDNGEKVKPTTMQLHQG